VASPVYYSPARARLAQKSKKTGEPIEPKPVNNTRADKLDSFMWRYSFENGAASFR
jgi:hypothetical protein